MKPGMILKMITDAAMTAVLLLLMAYSLVGEALHEWIGTAMFVLFILHHILNRRWSRNLCRGRYTAARVLQTALVALVLLSMLGSMASGVVLSRHVFSFLDVKGGRSLARNLHMISAYWGFVFMSLHLGLHWNMIMGMAAKRMKQPSAARTWTLRAVSALIAGYGVFAFVRRGIGRYMLMLDHFVFFDFDEPFVFFLADYIAAMGLFVFAGHYAAKAVRSMGTRRK